LLYQLRRPLTHREIRQMVPERVPRVVHSWIRRANSPAAGLGALAHRGVWE